MREKHIPDHVKETVEDLSQSRMRRTRRLLLESFQVVLDVAKGFLDGTLKLNITKTGSIASLSPVFGLITIRRR